MLLEMDENLLKSLTAAANQARCQVGVYATAVIKQHLIAGGFYDLMTELIRTDRTQLSLVPELVPPSDVPAPNDLPPVKPKRVAKTKSTSAKNTIPRPPRGQAKKVEAQT